MGIIKKIGKSIGKTFKKIGKNIKSAFKKFGKFMGKIGIVGQLAMSFILPGIGGALMKGLGAGFTKLTGVLAQGGKIAQAAGKVLEAGASFAKAGTSAFKTVTEGISNFVGEFSKTALKKVPGMQKIMPSLTKANDNFFIADASGKSAWQTVQDNVAANAADVLTNFEAGLESFGGAGKSFTAKGASAVAQAQATLGAGGTKAIPGATARGASTATTATAATTPQTSFTPKASDSLLSTPDFDLKAAGLDTVNVAKDTTGFSFTEKAESFVKGFPGEIKEGLTEKYTEFLGGRSLPKALVQEGADMALESAVSGVESGIEQRAYDLVQEKPPEQFGPSSTVGYQSVGISDYASPQVNDRAMQMSINPQAFLQANPIGVGAYNYYEEMKLRQGGSTAYG